jgi:hypothetical protein
MPGYPQLTTRHPQLTTHHSPFTIPPKQKLYF